MGPTDLKTESDAGKVPADRRPIASRSWGVFRHAAAWLTHSGVTPNAISASSMVFAALAGAAFWATSRVEDPVVLRLCWIAGGVLVQLRLIANLLDGMVAVEGGKGSPSGPLFNEAPDRVADACILLGAGWAAGSTPWLGAGATIVAVFVAYARALGASVGAGQVFSGPMAKPQRMAVVTGVAAAEAAALVSLSMERRLGFGLMSIALAAILVGGLVTAVRRLAEISRRLHAAADGDPDEGAGEP
ncbi:MAG: CDP-alcohol phosphatidyltransferase family protein [Planctomycetota bacterium]